MKQIPLYNRGNKIVAFAKVSDEDFTTLNARRWFWSHGYALSFKDGETVRMHRVVFARACGKNPEKHIDHKDRDKLNNQRENLRAASHSGNMLNKVLRKDNTIGYRGVYKDPRTGCYYAAARLDGKQKHIGTFDSKREAAIARDLFVQDHFDLDFAILNISDASEEEIRSVRAQMLKPKPRITGVSNFLGVRYSSDDRYTNKWVAQVYHSGEDHFLGRYSTKEEAAQVVDAKLLDLGLEYKMNFRNRHAS